jgi:hypothetical protein
VALSVEGSQRGEFRVVLSEEAAEVDQTRRRAGHGLGFARPALALQIGHEGGLKGGMDVNNSMSERLRLLPVGGRDVKDAHMEQHPMGATQSALVMPPPLPGLEATPSTGSSQGFEVVEGQLLEADVGLDEQTADGLRRDAQALNGGEPDRFGTLAEALHIDRPWTGGDLSPKTREFARHQVVVAGLEPAVDHQKDQERSCL